MSTADLDLITRAEAADICGVSLDTFARHVQREIDHYVIGHLR
jgi:hypothetical protein